MEQVYDSGSEIEAKTLELLPEYFNCSNDKISMDNRSGKKGPEAESVVVGKVGDRTYAFVGLERIGGIMIFDITEPDNSKYVNYINTRDFSADIAGDVSPEGLCFVDADKSNDGTAELYCANEVSGTVSIYAVEAKEMPEEPKLNGMVMEEDGMYHFYVDGVNDTKLTSLVFYDDVWVYINKGIWDNKYMDIVEYDGGSFFIANGMLVEESGLMECNGSWYYLSNGQVQKQYTGFASYDGAWFYITEGMLDSKVNGILDYDGGQFLIIEGRVGYDYSGLFLNEADSKWYYLAEGQVQKQYTGLASYDGAWFYIADGILDDTYTGTVEYDGSKFNIVNGMMVI